MRQPFAWVVALVLLLVVGTAGAQTATVAHDVLLDNSGSMRGFNESTLWPTLMNQLQQQSGQSWTFDSALRPFDGPLATAGLNSDVTDLGEAITSWVARSKPGAGAFIVTDNVADSSVTASLASQEKWEKELQSGRIAHLVLIPMRVPFAGTLYSPTSTGLTTPSYIGPRALALYLVVKASGDKDATRAMVRALEERAQNILNPLQQRLVPYTWLAITPFDVSGKSDEILLKLTETSEVTAKLENNILEVRDLTVGDRASFRFQADVRAGENFRLTSAEVNADLVFEDHNTLVTEKLITADVTPKRADLESRPTRFRIDFVINPFRLVNLSKWDLLMLGLSNETEVKGNLRIRYKVERGMVGLSKNVTGDWSYDGPSQQLHLGDTSIQSRIYRLTELVRQSVRNEELEQDALNIQVVMHVRYPLRPVAVAILLGAVGLGGLIYALTQMSRPRPYLGLNDINQEQMLTPSLLSPAYMVSSDGQCEVTIRWLLIGILVGTNGRLGSTRLLPVGGGAIEVTLPDSGGGTNFYSFSLEPQADPATDLDAEFN